MRVFADTNVLASAFGTRGLCTDVLRFILQRHELVTGAIVIEELRAALKRKFRMPAEEVDEIEQFLRSFHVEPKPHQLPALKLRDHSDLIVVASALEAKADVLITGDKELLALSKPKVDLRILSPREFWSLVAKR